MPMGDNIKCPTCGFHMRVAPAPTNDTASELQRLATLHGSGALTDAEFAAAKAKVIGA